MTDTDLDMERCVIGALLSNRDAIAAVADRLTPDAFADPMLATVYRAVLTCWERQVPPDIVTVHDLLETMPEGKTILASDLHSCMMHVWEYGWPAHVAYYAEAVVRNARTRAMADAGARIVKMSHDQPDTDPDLLIHEAMRDLEKFGAVEERRGPRTYSELVPDFQERMLRTRSGEIVNVRTATGFRDLDRRLAGGMMNGDLCILAARPGMGKTSFALNIAHNVAKAGRHVMVFSAEMSAESLLRRAAADLSGIDSAVIFGDAFTDAQFDQFLIATERLARLPVSIDDTSAISTAQMLVRVQAAQRLHDVGLVVFDYISLAGDMAGSDNENARVTAIVRKLKHIARECNVPVMALAQLNRNVERQDNKRPALSDLRDSGAIEQEADKVLFLYRHGYYVAMGKADPVPGKENVCEVNVAKHRNGNVGSVELYFRPETMTFHSVSHEGAA